ncbi:MAG: amidohydrolase family protein, partial [Kiritimatiellae bacterium]|nr:amidohydrolase family protein [Kiritimatiellia bacterium]
MPSQFHSVPQLVVLNAKIWSPHMPMPGANAVAISGGRITAVGRSDEILSLATAETLTIDAAGRFLVPGFNDAHVHLLHAGFCASGIDFRDTRDEEDFLARLRAYAQGLPPGKWILHGLWNHEAWPSGQYPTRHLLDRATGDHPTFLHRIDGHVAVANTLALLKAGITRDTPDPPG